MKLFENDFVRVRIYQKEARLYAEWLRNPSAEEYREGVNLMMKFMLEENIELWILDSTRLHGLTLSDQQWILNDILPMLQKSKVKKIARIGTGDIFHYMSFEELTEKAFKKYDVKIQVAQFTSMEMAEAWISMEE